MNNLLLVLFLVLCSSFVLAECSDGQIDINSASLEELKKITQVGPNTSIYIVDARPFKNLDDLTRVKGIKEGKLAKIKTEGLACVEDEKVEEDNSDEESKTEEADDEESEEEILEDEEEDVESKLSVEGKIELKAEIEKMVVEEKIVEEEIPEVVVLNGAVIGVDDEEVVYESTENKALRYAPYFLVILMLVVVGFLIIER